MALSLLQAVPEPVAILSQQPSLAVLNNRCLRSFFKFLNVYRRDWAVARSFVFDNQVTTTSSRDFVDSNLTFNVLRRAPTVTDLFSYE
jgi:hypothetical protein